MSGHPTWATTQHKKAASDVKRGKLFAHLMKEFKVAARRGAVILAGTPRAMTGF